MLNVHVLVLVSFSATCRKCRLLEMLVECAFNGFVLCLLEIRIKIPVKCVCISFVPLCMKFKVLFIGFISCLSAGKQVIIVLILLMFVGKFYFRTQLQLV